MTSAELVIAPLELPCFSHLPSRSYSWTINSYPLSFASQHCVPTMPALHRHQGAVSLMTILPANIVCHRTYSQQVSVMITSEHACRSSRGKGARRQCVSPVTAESLSHGVNPALEIHCCEGIHCTSPFTGLPALLSTLGVGPL